VVIGDGKLVVPVDFAIRRPNPTGPGGRCRDKLHWLQVMLDGRLATFRRRGVALPHPVVIADRLHKCEIATVYRITKTKNHFVEQV